MLSAPRDGACPENTKANRSRAAPAEDAAVAQDTLDTALAALTGDERDILLAQVWDGLTSSDIAVLYGLTPTPRPFVSHEHGKNLSAPAHFSLLARAKPHQITSFECSKGPPWTY